MCTRRDTTPQPRQAASLAQVRASTHPPSRSIEMLDGQTSRERNKEAESLKIARPA
jgi:hypothetical protein